MFSSPSSKRRVSPRIRDKRAKRSPAIQIQGRAVLHSIRFELSAWLAAHGAAHSEAIRALRQTPFATAILVLAIGVALTFPTLFYVFGKNLAQATVGLESANQISVFLKPELPNADAQRLAERLRKNPAIRSIHVITKEEALNDFKSFQPSLANALEKLRSNPLPAVLEILPQTQLNKPEDVAPLVANIQQHSEVDQVRLDLAWLTTLQRLLTVVRRLAWAVGGLFGLAVILLVGNTLRLHLQTHNEAIAVAKLLGATDAYVRRPLLYFGCYAGLAAGGLAWSVVSALLLWLADPVASFAERYGSIARILFLDVYETLALLGIAAALGMLSGLLFVTWHLRRLEVV